MICSQDDAPCSHINSRKIEERIEHCNLAWIFFYLAHYIYFCGCWWSITSINQTCASILAVVYVLLGRAVTEYRWGGSRNILFMLHKFLVLTVKKMSKSVYIYGSYHKIKTVLSLFLDHAVCRYTNCFSIMCNSVTGIRIGYGISEEPAKETRDSQ